MEFPSQAAPSLWAPLPAPLTPAGLTRLSVTPTGAATRLGSAPGLWTSRWPRPPLKGQTGGEGCAVRELASPTQAGQQGCLGSFEEAKSGCFLTQPGPSQSEVCTGRADGQVPTGLWTLTKGQVPGQGTRGPPEVPPSPMALQASFPASLPEAPPGVPWSLGPRTRR